MLCQSAFAVSVSICSHAANIDGRRVVAVNGRHVRYRVSIPIDACTANGSLKDAGRVSAGNNVCDLELCQENGQRPKRRENSDGGHPQRQVGRSRPSASSSRLRSLHASCKGELQGARRRIAIAYGPHRFLNMQPACLKWEIAQVPRQGVPLAIADRSRPIERSGYGTSYLV